MIGWFFAGIALLLISLVVLQWLSQAKPADVLSFVRGALLIAGIGAFVALAFSGRLLWALATIPAMLPWLIRFIITARVLSGLWRSLGGGRPIFGGGGSGPSGQVSEVESRFFQMRLDHDSGQMDGIVREGAFEGRMLSDLSLEELLTLHETCREDGDSLQLLESFLDRAHGEDWREGTAAQPESAVAPSMDKATAFRILELEEGASAEEIKAAHHRLMAKLHPDAGGSSYLAAQINRAREILLEDQDH